jgi:hypothetical protein
VPHCGSARHSSAAVSITASSALLPWPKITREQVGRRKLCVHPLPGLEGLQVGVSHRRVHAAPGDGEQLGYYSYGGTRSDSSLAGLSSGSVIIAYEPPSPGRLQ